MKLELAVEVLAYLCFTPKVVYAERYHGKDVVYDVEFKQASAASVK